MSWLAESELVLCITVYFSSDIVYDFDLMMQRKKEENYRKRKRKNIDIINDSDDVIAELISQMKNAADVRDF